MDPAVTMRLRRIERKLDMILEHLGLGEKSSEPLEGELDSEVMSLADQGRKIEAIKRHRELTGAELKEAKDAVEMYLGRD